MKFVILALTSLISFSSLAAQQGTSETKETLKASRNQLSVELLGTGGLVSLKYSHKASDRWVANLSTGYLTGTTIIDNLTVWSASASASYLAGLGNHRLDIEGGAGLYYFKNSGSSSVFWGPSENEAGLAPLAFVGLGYRYWPKTGGFHIRPMAYLLVNPSSADIAGTGGLSLGYAF